VKKEADGSILFACLYVDDLLFTGNNPTMFEAFKKSMVHEFEMTDIGLMAHFLGLEVVQKEEGIFVSQSSYAKDILERFKMESCNPVSTPVENGVELRKSKVGNVDPTYFKSLVGSLSLVCFIPFECFKTTTSSFSHQQNVAKRLSYCCAFPLFHIS
jgi:hypothetical protein